MYYALIKVPTSLNLKINTSVTIKKPSRAPPPEFHTLAKEMYLNSGTTHFTLD